MSGDRDGDASSVFYRLNEATKRAASAEERARTYELDSVRARQDADAHMADLLPALRPLPVPSVLVYLNDHYVWDGERLIPAARVHSHELRFPEPQPEPAVEDVPPYEDPYVAKDRTLTTHPAYTKSHLNLVGFLEECEYVRHAYMYGDIDDLKAALDALLPGTQPTPDRDFAVPADSTVVPEDDDDAPPVNGFATTY